MFRARSITDAVAIWRGMIGFDRAPMRELVGAIVRPGLAFVLAFSLFIVFLMPNTQQIMGRFDPAWNWKEWKDVARPKLPWAWKPSLAGLAFAGVTLFSWRGLHTTRRGRVYLF